MADSVSLATTNAVWFLVGPLDQADGVRYVPVSQLPFQIGRRQGLALSLVSRAVSALHAELCELPGGLGIRDLDSTNGTYVNGQPVRGTLPLAEDDLVQFADTAFRVCKQAGGHNTHTVRENVCDQALALVQFDKLMAERAATPYFQPIVDLTDRRVLAYEVLGRSRLFGLQNPSDMFRVAAQLNLEAELSVMLRWEGIRAGQAFDPAPLLFVNTHPREMNSPRLIESLADLREGYPQQPLVLEIHESAVTNRHQMSRLRGALNELNIQLAYDDFGAGQSRLNELAESPPDYLKFDMSLIRDIDQAPSQRQQVLSSLVSMTCDLGVVALAEGVETEAEHAVCLELGFCLGQGFLYGHPAPVPASLRRQH